MGVASDMSRPLYQMERLQIPIVQAAGWFLGPVWTGEKISSPVKFDPQNIQTVASQLSG